MACGEKFYTRAGNVRPLIKLTFIHWVKAAWNNESEAAWNNESEAVIRKSFQILTDLKTRRFAPSRKELWRLQQRYDIAQQTSGLARHEEAGSNQFTDTDENGKVSCTMTCLS